MFLELSLMRGSVCTSRSIIDRWVETHFAKKTQLWTGAWLGIWDRDCGATHEHGDADATGYAEIGVVMASSGSSR